jgi:hypothetical protein
MRGGVVALISYENKVLSVTIASNLLKIEDDRHLLNSGN